MAVPARRQACQPATRTGKARTGWCSATRTDRSRWRSRRTTLPKATWPEGPVPQQLHLDLTVATTADLDTQHDRALALGAQLLEDQSDDPPGTARVYADPAGHPFCIFVSTPPA